MTVTLVFSATAAVLFFGWGYDGCKKSALNTWMVLAVVTTVLMVWGAVSDGFYLWPVVTALCWLVKNGGLVFLACHMLHCSDHSAVGTSAVFLVYNCLAELICFTLLSLFATSPTVQFVFVAVLLIVTIGMVLSGPLP